jgi:N-acetylglucosaminyldiphosphoundecaprenol N-acetyl-beta-D-mannosaminyltransferase
VTSVDDAAPTAVGPPRSRVLGTAFFSGSLSAAADEVIQRALSGRGGYATLSGVHGVTLARRDAALRAALDGAWRNYPDGAPVAWRQRRDGLAGAERVGGPDLMPLVIDRGRSHELRHFLFGSTEEVLAALTARLVAAYPGAAIVGTLSPPFRPLTPEDDARVATAVQAVLPHIIWVGLGAPKQDLWCQRQAAAMAPALCLAVGAAFDFLAGTKRRAPEWMRRSGLEWLHRMAGDPGKLGPRYVQANSRYVARTTWELARDAVQRRGAART